MQPHALNNEEGFHTNNCDYCAGLLDLVDLLQLKYENVTDKELPEGIKIINNVPYISVITLSKVVDELIS
jgi:hypothetical protein